MKKEDANIEAQGKVEDHILHCKTCGKDRSKEKCPRNGVNCGISFVAQSDAREEISLWLQSDAGKAEMKKAMEQVSLDIAKLNEGRKVTFEQMNTPMGVEHIAAQPAAPQQPQLKHRTGDCVLCGHCAATGQKIQPTAQQHPYADAVREIMREALAEQLNDLYYCGRVWEAWQVGTMTQDDFSIASEVDDIVDNFVNAAMYAIASTAQSTAQQDTAKLLKRASALLWEIPANAPNTIGLRAYEIAADIDAAIQSSKVQS